MKATYQLGVFTYRSEQELVLHNCSGPAVDTAMVYLPEWYINGNKIDEHHYKQWLIDNGMDINNLSDQDEEMIILVWGPIAGKPHVKHTVGIDKLIKAV